MTGESATSANYNGCSYIIIQPEQERIPLQGLVIVDPRAISLGNDDESNGTKQLLRTFIGDKGENMEHIRELVAKFGKQNQQQTEMGTLMIEPNYVILTLRY